MIYKNPVISGFHPDPSVCKVGEEYYLVTSSFEYFPGVPIYHSVNLVNWKQIGYVLTQESQLPLTRIHSYTTSQGIYAPTIRYHNARFYVITTNVTVGKTFYVWAEDPKGPWSEPVVIENLRGFDPSLFFDDDGKVYLTYAHFPGFGNDGIFQAELDIDTGRLLNEPVLIWHGTGGHSPEGPHLYKINGWYYLLIAEGGTEYGHMVTVARSRKPFGEYESCPNNPIVSNRSSDKPIQGTGHADLVQDHNGEWWSVMLGFRPVKTSKLHHLGRETNLAPVAWDEDGWPSIGLNGQVDVEYDAKSLKVVNKEKGEDREDFSNHNLSLEWNFYRNPLAESWSLTEKPDHLTLYGQAAALNDPLARSFIGRRLQHFNCEISTFMEFQPIEDGEEAGLTVFMNDQFHYEIAKKRKNRKCYLIFRRCVGSINKIEEVEFNEPSVNLRVEANDTMFTFSFLTVNGNETVIGSGETAFLSTQIAGGFTGVYVGMYATGNGRVSNSPACFDYFIYKPSNEK